MADFLFSEQAKWLWIAALTAALFFPVRKLIWIMTVRRAVRKGGGDKVDEAEQARLMRRAAFTSTLLCFLFSLFYVSRLFQP
jgi:hypothetical protein